LATGAGTEASAGGVYELKIDCCPGYRVYYALNGKTVILLLLGKDKSTQIKDISLANAYWKDHKERAK
jgi:putative addiction module killer protein